MRSQKKKKPILEIIDRIEKMEKKKFLIFCAVIFVIFTSFGFLLGDSIKSLRIYQLERYEERLEKETLERINNKIRVFQTRSR